MFNHLHPPFWMPLNVKPLKLPRSHPFRLTIAPWWRHWSNLILSHTAKNDIDHLIHSALQKMILVSLFSTSLKDDLVHCHRVTPFEVLLAFLFFIIFFYVSLFYLLKDQIHVVAVHLFWRVGVTIQHLSMSVTLFCILLFILSPDFNHSLPFRLPFLPFPWFVYLC